MAASQAAEQKTSTIKALSKWGFLQNSPLCMHLGCIIQAYLMEAWRLRDWQGAMQSLSGTIF